MEPDYIICDSHAHLTDESFTGDLEEVIERAHNAGVGLIIVPGNNLKTSERAVELAKAHTGLYAAVGLHPHEAECLDTARDKIETLARRGVRNGLIVAIGETGLDYYYNYSSKEAQLKAFRWHIGLARELGVPIIIHSRNSEEDIKNTLKLVGVPPAGGVLHCFTGSENLARWALDIRLRISYSGTITFLKKGKTNNVIKITPLSKTMIETDSPYLCPEPKRGKRNEPANLRYIAARLAVDCNVDKNDVYAETTLSARELFGLPVDFGGSIVYRIGNNLYINLTNRCPNRCAFCVREFADGVGGYKLKLRAEPTINEIIDAIVDPTRYAEVVFCGFGEPTIRWRTVKEAARWVKENGGRTRLNTNGLSALVNATDITKEMPGLIDEVSVSLNASDPDTYKALCKPRHGELAWPTILDFIYKASKVVKTRASMVRHATVNEREVQRFAEEMGVPLKIRG
jgi:TatD DNase family protein